MGRVGWVIVKGMEDGVMILVTRSTVCSCYTSYLFTTAVWQYVLVVSFVSRTLSPGIGEENFEHLIR